jgi:hypothetical protein
MKRFKLYAPSSSAFCGDQSMRISRYRVWTAVLLGLFFVALAQSAQSAPATSPEQSFAQIPPSETSARTFDETEAPKPAAAAAPTVRRPRRVLCWREAGISPKLVNQRWQIEADAKAKIGGACSDDSLTPERKRDKVRQIDAETEREIAKIIPAEQLAAFKGCQAEHDWEKAQRAGSTPRKELGPCGGVIPAQTGAPPHSHDHQGDDRSKR